MKDNYIYLIEDHDSPVLAVVDPADAALVRKACDALEKPLTHILNTHHHWDHTDGNKSLKSSFDCQVVGANIDTGRIPAIDIRVEEGEAFRLGSIDIEVLFVPGHTRGHIAYLLEDALFCGDTLFGAGCGRLFEGTPEQMWQSLTRLAALPDETWVYCAHEYTLANLCFAEHVDPANAELARRVISDAGRRADGLPTIPSTIAVERATNPFLRPLNPEFTRDYSKKYGIDDSALAVFADLRAKKDRY